MTQLDIYFPSIRATCKGVNELIVSIGTVLTVSGAPEGNWFVNNDNVLTVLESDGYVKAESEGSSTIKFIQGDRIVGSFTITVIPDQAASLGLSAGTPIIK